MKSTHYLGSAAALVLLSITGTLAIDGFGDSLSKPIQAAMNKLDSYALEATASSGISLDLLERANEQFKSWDEKVRETLMNHMPLFRLFVVTALNPIENLEMQLHDTSDDYDTIRDAYIRRLELVYKTFRPGYLGRFVTDTERNKARKLTALINAIVGLDAKPLDVKMFQGAKLEFEAALARLHEIEHYEDVYGCLQEWKQLVNLFNYGPVTALLDMNALEEFPDLSSEKEMRRFKKDYTSRLRKRNWRVEGEGLVWYGYPKSL